MWGEIVTLFEYFIIVLGVAGFGLQHSGLSALRVKSRIIKRWGKKGFSRIFTITSVLALLVAVWTVNFYDLFYFFTAHTRLNLILALPGGVLVVIGVIVALAASKTLSVSTIADMKSDRKVELVTSGIYAWIRHPLYLASILILVGLVLIYPFPKVITFSVSLCGYVLIGAYLEERKLILQYGSDYLAYRKKTGFMFPRW